MDWLQTLFTDVNSIAHIVLLYAFVIAVGVLLGKIKFFGVSLGVTFVLFTGIVCGHFGFTGNTQILTFMQDFGLILFVYCIGLQVGPSFFTSFKKGGVSMNVVAVGVVLLNVAVALGLYYALGGRIELPMMVGILCGAVTNTPGLGAAKYIAANTASEVQATVTTAMEQQGNVLNMFLDFIPSNPLEAFASGHMVSIIVFILMFAGALAKVGDVNRPIVAFFESVFAATMKITDWIMFFAAPGVFALTASAVSSFGIDIFMSISKYLGVLLVGFAIQMFVVYPLFLKTFSKVSAPMLFSAIAEAMMVAFGTASSSATLPLTIACCEKRGISHKVTSFVIPLGATLNMDGTALLQVVAVIFLAQAYGVVLTPFLIVQSVGLGLNQFLLLFHHILIYIFQ